MPNNHYPLALQSWIDTALADGGDQSIERINRIMKYPWAWYRPLPQALRFHQSKKNIRFSLGGNRSSKSRSSAQEVAYFALGCHPWRQISVPNEGWYCTLKWEMVGSVLWSNLKPIIQGTGYKVHWHNKGRGIPEIVEIPIDGSKEPSRIIFKAYGEGDSSFQGVERRWICNDEQFPENVFIEQLSRVGSKGPIDFWAPMTPIIPQPWLEEKLTIKRPKEWDVFEFPLDDNRLSRGGFIEDEQIDAMIDRWPIEVVETRRNGKWGSFVGAIFQTFSRDVHVVSEWAEKAEFFIRNGKPPAQEKSKGAIDWGGGNPFVFLWGIYLPHLEAWYIYDEYYWAVRVRGQKRLQDHADEIIERTKAWGTSLERVWADHDPTNANEFSYMGVPSQPANKDVALGIEYMQTLLKVNKSTGRPGLYIASRCSNLIRTIIAYRYQEGTDKRDSKGEPVKKDDDPVDSARYLCYSEKLSSGTGEYVDVSDVAGYRF